MSDTYMLHGHLPIRCDDLLMWARWFEQSDRQVALTVIDSVKISTVFLGLDHQLGDGPPLLFETMIFGGLHDDAQWRYSTWKAAEDGHRMAVALVKEHG